MNNQNYKIALCIGAQKAGTSWFFRCLQEHPEISCAQQKEVHFFSEQFDEEKYDDYLKNFDTSKKILFEASTSYLSNPSAAEQIQHCAPEAKIIVLLRDPSERLISHYKHLVSKGRLKNQNLNEAIEMYPDLVENGLYGKHLSQYFNSFKRDEILVLFYDEIKSDPQALIDKTCHFLGIKPFTPKALRYQYHSSEARLNPLYLKIVKRYNKFRKTNTGKKTLPILRSIGLNAILFDRVMKWTSRKKSAIPFTRDEIMPIFAEDTTYLSRFIGKVPWNKEG